MATETKPDLIYDNLITQGKEYHKKAEYYRNNGELEGALINYLLSTSNLYNWHLYCNLCLIKYIFL